MRLLRESDSLDKNTLTHNFMQHTRVLGCSQFTRCISEIIKKNRAGLFVFRKRFVFYRFTLQVNLGDKSGGV